MEERCMRREGLFHTATMVGELVFHGVAWGFASYPSMEGSYELMLLFLFLSTLLWPLRLVCHSFFLSAAIFAALPRLSFSRSSRSSMLR